MFVKKFPRQMLLTLIAATVLLSSCGGGEASPTLDIEAINTTVAGTAIAQLSSQLTQTALAAPPTPTPTDTPQALPTSSDGSPIPTISFDASPTSAFGFTPLPAFTQIGSTPAQAATAPLGDACNNNVFEGDITIPDGSNLKPGEDFEKIWKIRNTGTCTWDDGYTLVFIAGDRAIDPYDFEFTKSDDFVAPGAAINIGIWLTAPLTEGSYQGHWRMRSDRGVYFGTILSVYFNVKK
jgi:hypothetical protein